MVACAVLHNIACNMGDVDPPVNNEEIEAAINLTNNVHNYINTREVEAINNSVRHVLITQYFQNL